MIKVRLLTGNANRPHAGARYKRAAMLVVKERKQAPLRGQVQASSYACGCPFLSQVMENARQLSYQMAQLAYQIFLVKSLISSLLGECGDCQEPFQAIVLVSNKISNFYFKFWNQLVIINVRQVHTSSRFEGLKVRYQISWQRNFL